MSYTYPDIIKLGFNYFLPRNIDTHKCEGLYFDENYTKELDNNNLNLLIDNKIEHLYAKWVEIE